MLDFREWSSMPIFSNPPLAWLIAIAVAAGLLTLLIAGRRLLRAHYQRLRVTPQREFLEVPLHVLAHTTSFSLIVVSVVLGVKTLALGPAGDRIIDSLITIALFWQVGAWIVAAISAWLYLKRERSLATDPAAAGSITIIGFMLKTLTWTLVLLLTLDNLGVNITALLTGLGIGGIAVALAVQNVLGDLFASLSITLDRPFRVGDALSVGDVQGTVVDIGIKSTRLRSTTGEQIIMGNADLLKSRVRNYGRMIERCVTFATSVAYETPLELIERIPALLRELVEAQPGTRFDRSHFKQHTPGSLDFETVYYVMSPDTKRYMDIQQAINLGLHRKFAELGIQFAHPTQRLLVQSTQLPGKEEAGRAAA